MLIGNQREMIETRPRSHMDAQDAKIYSFVPTQTHPPTWRPLAFLLSSDAYVGGDGIKLFLVRFSTTDMMRRLN